MKRKKEEATQNENPWGDGDIMVMAAVRYCLGRQSYIVGMCADWLIKWWPDIDESCKLTIKRDIEEAFKRDDESRARKYKAYHPLGMDMDRREWERARKLWEND